MFEQQGRTHLYRDKHIQNLSGGALSLNGGSSGYVSITIKGRFALA